MENCLTYREINTIIEAANHTFKNWYETIGDEEDKNFIDLCNELQEQLLKSPAWFFKIVEDEPF